MKTLKNRRKYFTMLCVFIYTTIFYTNVYAESSGVSDMIQDAWDTMKGDTKTVTNDVIFPAISVILAIALIVKGCLAYFDYRKNGQFEFVTLGLLFFGLILSLSASVYVWKLVD